MICSKCGQELMDGTNFCTQCGTSFRESSKDGPVNPALPILSIVLSVIGIIMRWAIPMDLLRWFISPVLIHAGVLVALISLYKQKSFLGVIAGLIPWTYLIGPVLLNLRYIF